MRSRSSSSGRSYRARDDERRNQANEHEREQRHDDRLAALLVFGGGVALGFGTSTHRKVSSANEIVPDTGNLGPVRRDDTPPADRRPRQPVRFSRQARQTVAVATIWSTRWGSGATPRSAWSSRPSSP